MCIVCIAAAVESDDSTPDLALYRLIDMLGGDHETLAELADELLSAAIEEVQS